MTLFTQKDSILSAQKDNILRIPYQSFFEFVKIPNPIDLISIYFLILLIPTIKLKIIMIFIMSIIILKIIFYYRLRKNKYIFLQEFLIITATITYSKKINYEDIIEVEKYSNSIKITYKNKNEYFFKKIKNQDKEKIYSLINEKIKK